MKYKIITPHKSSFPKPIHFSIGDPLTLGKRDKEYPGWVWVTTPSGNEGWAPESLIQINTNETGTAQSAYDARELDTIMGERVICTDEIAGWLWVENDKGECGWIPKETARRMNK